MTTLHICNTASEAQSLRLAGGRRHLLFEPGQIRAVPKSAAPSVRRSLGQSVLGFAEAVPLDGCELPEAVVRRLIAGGSIRTESAGEVVYVVLDPATRRRLEVAKEVSLALQPKPRTKAKAETKNAGGEP